MWPLIIQIYTVGLQTEMAQKKRPLPPGALDQPSKNLEKFLGPFLESFFLTVFLEIINQNYCPIAKLPHSPINLFNS